MTQILTFWVESADLEKLTGTSDKICENAYTLNVSAMQNPSKSQMDQIHQLQSIDQVEALSVRSGQYALRHHW